MQVLPTVLPSTLVDVISIIRRASIGQISRQLYNAQGRTAKSLIVLDFIPKTIEDYTYVRTSSPYPYIHRSNILNITQNKYTPNTITANESAISKSPSSCPLAHPLEVE